jgi:hypothetical protein
MDGPPLDDGGVYDEDEDGPEARLFRQQASDDANWAAITHWQAEWLLARIEARDARRTLIPWRMVRYWNLPNRRRWT